MNPAPTRTAAARRWPVLVLCAAALTTAVMVVATVAGCGVWSAPAAASVVVVGVDVDLTGAGPGIAYDHALRLAVEQVNERELAGSGRRVELRVLDNRAEAALSAQNLSTLAGDPAVTAVITAGCASCVIDAAASLSLPVIALSGQEAVAAPAAQRRWVFRLGPNAADNADLLSATMAAAGVSTVAVVTVSDAYGRDGARWFAQAADRDGLHVTARVELAGSAGQAQITHAAATILDTEPGSSAVDGQEVPDAVLLWVYPPQAAALAQALRTAGYHGQLYADMIAADELFGPGPLAGARLVATSTAIAAERIAASPAAAARQEWVLAYVSRHGGYQLHSTWAADALLVLADAVNRAGGTDRDQVRAHIESARIDGITGPIRFTAQQHSGLLPAALVMLTATGDRWQ